MPLITVILFIFFILYLSFGIYILLQMPGSLKNRIFFSICLHLSIWSFGYALMSCATTRENANYGREIASLGWCFIYSLWLDFAILLYKDEDKKWMTDFRRLIIYLPSLFFLYGNLRYQPEEVIIKFAYIWRDTYPLNYFEILYNIHYTSYIFGGIIFIYLWGKKSDLNSEKRQAETLIKVALLNFGVGMIIKLILPMFTINVFPMDILIFIILIFGIYHAMMKYQLMAITTQDVNDFLIIGRKQQIARLESLGTLSGGIAHDFNNIISGILGYSQLTLEDLEKDSIHADNLNEILKLGERAKNIVSQILTFSKGDQIKKEKVNLDLIVVDVFNMLKTTMLKNIKFRYIKPEISCYVHADVGEMQQIIMNVCANAYQAIDHDSGIVTIELSEQGIDTKEAESFNLKKTGLYVQIVVNDNGCGMDEEVKKRIFEPFFTKRGSNEGTGLGLFIVHGIVNAMEGAIKVDSEIGKGSTFTIVIPKYIGTDEMVQPLSPSVSLNEKVRILLVDDEISIVTSVKKLLSRRGYIVTGVTDSQVALQQFIHEPQSYDILLSDQFMPKLTGDELLKEIRKIRPELPAIICSGYTQIQSRNNTEYLIKPVSVETYISAIEKLCNG